VLPDVLRPGLRAVFCGTAAGTASALAGAYYAHPGNRFWRVLHTIGMVPRQLHPSEFALLVQWRLGLTDVAKRASGADRDLPPGCFDRSGFAARIMAAAPGVVAFNGKAAARAATGLRTDLPYGPLALANGLPPGFVLPSTSGAASGFWDEGPWRDLARIIAK